MDDYDVIDSYTTQDAINDGALIEIDRTRWPHLCISPEAHRAAEAAALRTGRTLAQVLVPLAMDAVMIARTGMEADPDETEYLWTEGLEGNATGLELWVCLNDAGGITITTPDKY